MFHHARFVANAILCHLRADPQAPPSSSFLVWNGSGAIRIYVFVTWTLMCAGVLPDLRADPEDELPRGTNFLLLLERAHCHLGPVFLFL
jgi:hypothetical protein